jgi:hypothetical protein
LGSVITAELNEDAEVKTRINKAKSVIGLAKHFFNNKDVDIRTKHNVYTLLAINTVLWDANRGISLQKIKNSSKASTTALLEESSTFSGNK